LRIVVIAGLAESLINFRGPLIAGFLENGHEVICLAPGDHPETAEGLRALGASYQAIELDRTGMNPWHDLKALSQLRRLLKRLKPDIVLGYTIKPVLYGSIAARLAGVPRVFSMITGLGYAFMGGALKQRCINRLVCALYRVALGKNRRVFFQNGDDLELFNRLGLLRGDQQAVLVNGSGVDLKHFPEQGAQLAPIRFLLIARLLRDKGIFEYVEAAAILRRSYPDAVFQLLGPLDSNPSGISRAQVEDWVGRCGIEYLGTTKDVRPYLARASVYVLPSYREGTPRTVLEAMATGRPVITTDTPGCRETVRHGENGLLVPVKDVDSLVRAMESFIVSPQLAVQMGRRSRLLAEEKYDVIKVNRVIMTAMELCGGAP
jgi:glycosyltransferase involved in cell wall biosynthesis